MAPQTALESTADEQRRSVSLECFAWLIAPSSVSTAASCDEPWVSNAELSLAI
jgi:hypothetical protein